MMATSKSSLFRVRNRAFAPVDIASLVFFRIAFGLLMIWQVGRYLAEDWIAIQWLEPRFLFKYYGFSWIHPWPGNWLYIHWVAIGIFALFVAAGFFYRLSATLMFLSYTYFFLLDEARYVNHTYLLCLFSFLLIIVPAHRAFSIDAWLKPNIRSNSAPQWSLWLMRFQIAVVYFFAGLAKLSPDWLQGEPMRVRMAQVTDVPIIGRFFHEEWAIYAVSYGGLLLDLFIVPLLLWPRTRLAAFCAAVAFHFINAIWWPLGVFPWLSITATTLFFSPSWPRQILPRLKMVSGYVLPAHWKSPAPTTQRMILTLLAVYAAIQLLVPLRHFLWAGGVEWRYVEHRFSWRMMLVSVSTRSTFYVTDPNNDSTRQVGTKQFLSRRQALMLGYLPDFALQYAHYLATVQPRTGPKPLQVEARIFSSINGRPPTLYIDPNVDLAAEARTLGRPRWLLLNREPLPSSKTKPADETTAPNSGEN